MKPSTLSSKLGKENPTDTNKVLKNIRKLGGNKSCFDCREKWVTYVVSKFGTFVCSRCSGIHREIGNMVKGLGVSNFTDKEINFLQEMEMTMQKRFGWLNLIQVSINYQKQQMRTQ